MALLFLDSFDHYATADLTEKWTAIDDTTVDPTVTASGRTANCLRWTTAGTNQALSALTLTPVHAPGDATMIVGFAYRISDVSSAYTWNNGSHFFAIYNGAVLKCAFKANSDGTWSWGNDATAADYTSAGVPIQDNTWAYVEFKVVLHDTTGSVAIRVNGTTVLSETNIDTIASGVAAWTSIKLFNTTNIYPWLTNATVDLDDFYLLDGTTGTGKANNDFWGDTSVRYLAPNADTATKDWTPSAVSDNYALVDETSPDDDTTYISTSTVNATDLYDFPAVTTGATVNGVQAVIAAKKGDTGSCQIAAICKSGGTTAEHASPLGVASDTAYSYFCFPWDSNPDGTPAQWTETTLNAAQFGPRKTA